MKIHLVHLDPKLPTEPNAGAAARLVPMTPGVYDVKLLEWIEGNERRVSAWHAWGGIFEEGQRGWLNCFYGARWTGENIDAATKQTFGLSSANVFKSPQDAFAAFPSAEAPIVVPTGFGGVVPMMFWLTATYEDDLGEMRIELRLKS